MKRSDINKKYSWGLEHDRQRKWKCASKLIMLGWVSRLNILKTEYFTIDWSSETGYREGVENI